MITDFFVVVVSSILWRLGGTNKSAWMRDVLIPILLGAWAFHDTYNWVIAISTIATYQIIRIGYGAYDPINNDKPSFLGFILKDTEGWKTRGIAGLLYGLIGAMPLMINKCLVVGVSGFIGYIDYAALICVISGILSYNKAKDWVIEPAIGALVGSIVFFL